ncbi:hypothetical protein EDE12_101762 [Methylosinus sp. sav-2]|uniref:DUF6456 domain-containing protein n=1 Tax=Methylosinus sp. sav-2 TaxID=2485168 RepID=UPI000479FCD1|nr:DUF6456 domain-containing protein [Methylosinus sp. sav-2]TDX67219.1 hypothetical protein EDE12_101762 [Methylosinus sp. sav-2]
MSTTQRHSDETEARALRRLLEAMSEPGAQAMADPLGARSIIVAAPRKGVTVARARLAQSIADIAAARGLARWDGAGEARRLHLTDEGRAHLRRLAAPAEANPFFAQHSALAPRVVEKGARPTLVNEGESPLAWLARRKDRDGRPFLAPEQIEAGERFRRDVTQAAILQRVTADWEAAIGSARGGGAGADIANVAIDARRRLSHAFDAVGPELCGLLTDVCGYLKGLELIESERGWPQRSAKVVLKIALERLALHYGLASAAQGPERARHLLHWGVEDYRPTL